MSEQGKNNIFSQIKEVRIKKIFTIIVCLIIVSKVYSQGTVDVSCYYLSQENRIVEKIIEYYLDGTISEPDYVTSAPNTLASIIKVGKSISNHDVLLDFSESYSCGIAIFDLSLESDMPLYTGPKMNVVAKLSVTLFNADLSGTQTDNYRFEVVSLNEDIFSLDDKSRYELIMTAPAIAAGGYKSGIIQADVSTIVNEASYASMKVIFGIRPKNEDQMWDAVKMAKLEYNGTKEAPQYTTVNVNQKKDNASYGKVKYWAKNNKLSEEKYVPYSIPSIQIGTNVVLKADQKLSSDYQKYSYWREMTQVPNSRKFLIDTDNPNFTSYFEKAYDDVVIRNIYDGVNQTISGVNENLLFKDPWLADIPEPIYGYKNGGNQDATF